MAHKKVRIFSPFFGSVMSKSSLSVSEHSSNGVDAVEAVNAAATAADSIPPEILELAELRGSKYAEVPRVLLPHIRFASPYTLMRMLDECIKCLMIVGDVCCGCDVSINAPACVCVCMCMYA